MYFHIDCNINFKCNQLKSSKTVLFNKPKTGFSVDYKVKIVNKLYCSCQIKGHTIPWHNQVGFSVEIEVGFT